MAKPYLVFDGATVLDVSIRCADCEASLENRTDYEPFIRLDTTTGESTNVDVCASCIADIERINASNAVITGRLARQIRRAKSRAERKIAVTRYAYA